MDYLLFGKAAMVGLSIAAPVGPIGLLCMQRTLLQGPRAGFVCGLGAATADAIYGAIGAFGLTAITHLFTSLSTPLTLFGGLFLAWLGFQLLRTKPVAGSSDGSTKSSALNAYLSTLALTLTNPMTILSFLAIFAALSDTDVLAPRSASLMVLGVFFGSALWWLLLAASVSLVRHRIGSSTMLWISRSAGVFLLGFAGWQLQSILL